MLRWMCGMIRRDTIINDNVRERVRERVGPTVEKMVETRLR
jgi:hypothetical protein